MDLSSSSDNEVGVESSRKRKRSITEKDERENNIQVVVRCRKRIEHEITANSPAIIKTTPREILINQLQTENLPRTYTFDKVFGPEADQTTVFDHLVVPILHDIKLGYSCTLLAYGSTLTGKTYTMEGDLDLTNGLISENAGIIPRILFNLFQDLEAEVRDFSVKISYIELYNENLKDLLSPSNDDLSKFTGHEEVLVNNAADGIRVLKQGSAKRRVAQTDYNRNSSLSHSVFSITVRIKETTISENGYKVGKFNLIDLAGSECIDQSGIRKNEVEDINDSTLTLSQCINVLNERCLRIPFRLTHLLQDNSLGEKPKICIIATISPTESSYDETMSTIDYAHQAKYICNVNQRATKKALVKECEIEHHKTNFLAAQKKIGHCMDQLLADKNQRQKDEVLKELQKENEISQEENEESYRLQRKIKVLQELNEKLQKGNEELQEARRKIKELQEESEEIKEDNKELQKENKELRRQNEELRGENEELQEDNEELQAENEELQGLRRKNADLQGENEELREENEDLQEGNEELQAENEELQELRRKNAEFRGENEELREENEDLQEDNEELQAENEELQELRRKNAELQGENEELREENEDLQEGNEELQAENEELQELRRKHAELRGENEELQEDNEELQAENKELRELRRKNEELRGENEELWEDNEELEELRRKNAELRGENEELQEDNEELQAEN